MALKFAFIDTETTGTDHMKHGLFMIGGIIRVDDVIKEEFKITCDLFAGDEFDPASAKSHGYNADDLHKFQDPVDAHKEFTDILGKYVDKYDKTDKYLFLNFGAEFDNKFLHRWFEGCADQYFHSWFWHPWVDVMSLAANALRRERHKMPNFKLVTVARQLSIPVDDDSAHDPLYDAGLAMQVYDRLMVISNPVKNNDGGLIYKMPRKRRQ